MGRRGIWVWARGGLVLGGLLLLLSGCGFYEYLYGRGTSRETRRSDQDLLRSAEIQMQRRRFEEARKDLQRLMNQYPDSDLVSVARLSAARSLYQEKKYDEAQAELLRFLELYPQHERLDEAHYYLAMAYYRQADSADRDQSLTLKALGQFELLLKQMPDSQYAADAQERMQICRRKLAEKEVYVGVFYFQREHYAAAVGRLQAALTRYPGAGFDDRALYYLGESLWRLEQRDEARAVLTRLVQEHSQSEWAGPAARRLGITLVRTGPPPPKGPGPFRQMWEGVKTTWDELADTVRDTRIFQ